MPVLCVWFGLSTPSLLCSLDYIALLRENWVTKPSFLTMYANIPYALVSNNEINFLFLFLFYFYFKCYPAVIHVKLAASPQPGVPGRSPHRRPQAVLLQLTSSSAPWRRSPPGPPPCRCPRSPAPPSSRGRAGHAPVSHPHLSHTSRILGCLYTCF